MPTGTCLCGDIAWEIDGPFEWMAHCHCTMCRKAHGAAFATFVTFRPEALRWLRGEGSIRGYRSSPDSVRNFCGRCGSKLPSLEPFAYAFPAPMEGDFGILPQDHICVAWKAPWHQISDDLTQHPVFRDETRPMPTPRHTEAEPDKVRGSCLCGQIAYELDALEGGAIVNCHCSRCRRARATLHGSMLFVENATFRWLRGEDHLLAFKVPDAARFMQSFCDRCGSAMPAKSDPPSGFRGIPCGSLDDDPGAREGLHLMVGSKAPWHVISGDLPQHDGYPATGFPPKARSRRA